MKPPDGPSRTLEVCARVTAAVEDVAVGTTSPMTSGRIPTPTLSPTVARPPERLRLPPHQMRYKISSRAPPHNAPTAEATAIATAGAPAAAGGGGGDGGGGATAIGIETLLTVETVGDTDAT